MHASLTGAMPVPEAHLLLEHYSSGGDIGTGKSTCLSFIVDNLTEQRLVSSSTSIVYQYYCQIGNYVSLLSSLLLQLLQDFPMAAEEAVFEAYQSEQKLRDRYPEANAHSLERMLTEALQSVGHRTVLVIDALDEFDGEQRRQLEKYLKLLLERVSGLGLVLSYRSNHWLPKSPNVPTIHIAPCVERDRMIVESLVKENLDYLLLGVQRLVINRLSALAHGNARWTAAVVKLIERRNILAFGEMEQFLKQIPFLDDLHYTYNDTFGQYTKGDEENREIAVAALKLLAVSRRQLSLTELAWAVELTFKKHSTTPIASLGNLLDPRRVISLIGPFIARIDRSDTKKRQVRLVHHSVKDFIFSSISTSLETPINVKKEAVEAEMLNVCVKYLLRDELEYQPLFSETQLAIRALPQEVDLFHDGNAGAHEYTTNCTWEEWEKSAIHYDPAERGFGEFFVYAACHWLDHFSAITTTSLVDYRLIERLCEAGSTRLSNWMEQNRRPDCAIQPRFEFDPSLYDSLSISALFASKDVFQHMLNHWRSSRSTTANFLREPITAAASQVKKWGDSKDLGTQHKSLMLRHLLKHQSIPFSQRPLIRCKRY